MSSGHRFVPIVHQLWRLWPPFSRGLQDLRGVSTVCTAGSGSWNFLQWAIRGSTHTLHLHEALQCICSTLLAKHPSRLITSHFQSINKFTLFCYKSYVCLEILPCPLYTIMLLFSIFYYKTNEYSLLLLWETQKHEVEWYTNIGLKQNPMSFRSITQVQSHASCNLTQPPWSPESCFCPCHGLAASSCSLLCIS